MGVVNTGKSYKEELKRNKRIVNDIKGIVVRSSHYSFPDGPETHCIEECISIQDIKEAHDCE